MVDAIMVQSNSSNCKQDMDKFLLKLTNFTGAERPKRPAPAVIRQDSVDEDTLQCWVIAQPPPPEPSQDILSAQENILYYIAGYIARKLQSKVCVHCRARLMGQLSGTDHEAFLCEKQYSALASEQGLCVASTHLFRVVQSMERLFQTHASFLFHYEKIFFRLVHMFEECGDALFSCQQPQPCSIQKLTHHLFLNIRLHFFLKDCSRGFSDKSVKRNWKVLKLSHA
jgi:hypothetical protein